MLLHSTPDSFDVPSVEDDRESSTIPHERRRRALSEPEVNAILEAQESPRLEFKRVSGKMVSKALETLCAFANSSGGTLILGIADPSLGSGADRIFGIEENPEAVDELRRKIETQFDPPGIPVRYRFVPVTTPQGLRLNLMMLQADRSDHVHSIVGDGTWTRLGASNAQMTARQISELAYKRSCGSRARNPLIARALFDFPVRPNIDAGEGVRMMFAEMERTGLYAPLYRESSGAAGDSVTVVLLSDSRSELWNRVSDWIDRNGPIGNAVVASLGGVDTVKASRVLRKWTNLGLLQVLEGRGRKNRVYDRPG